MFGSLFKKKVEQQPKLPEFSPEAFMQQMLGTFQVNMEASRKKYGDAHTPQEYEKMRAQQRQALAYAQMQDDVQRKIRQRLYYEGFKKELPAVWGSEDSKILL